MIGFTLIELMIVISIIAALAAVALPSYRAFSARAKVSECISLLNPFKTAFTEYVSSMGGLPPSGASCVPFACNDDDQMSQYCRGLTTVDDIIEIDIRPQAGVKDSCYIRLKAFVTGSRVDRWEGQTTCQFDEVPPEFRNRPR